MKKPKLTDLSYDEIMELPEDEFYKAMADFFIELGSKEDKQDIIIKLKLDGITVTKEKFTQSLVIFDDLFN